MSAYTLPAAQQLAILLLRKSDLSLACVSKLREEHAPHPSELDYFTLMQAGLATKTPAGVRILTPIGKLRADQLACEIAQRVQLHMMTYGRSASGGAWFVRCSCGEFTITTPNAIRGPMTRLGRAASMHLDHVEKKSAPLGDRSAPQQAQEAP